MLTVAESWSRTIKLQPASCDRYRILCALQASIEVAERLHTVGIAAVYINSSSSHIDTAVVVPGSSSYATVVAQHTKDYADWFMLTKVRWMHRLYVCPHIIC